MSDYLLKTELARLMGVHHSTIGRAIRAGRIQTVAHLGRHVIPRQEAQRLLEPLGIPLPTRDNK
jgi:excisionase family DNA binding protein